MKCKDLVKRIPISKDISKTHSTVSLMGQGTRNKFNMRDH